MASQVGLLQLLDVYFFLQLPRLKRIRRPSIPPTPIETRHIFYITITLILDYRKYTSFDEIVYNFVKS